MTEAKDNISIREWLDYRFGVYEEKLDEFRRASDKKFDSLADTIDRGFHKWNERHANLEKRVSDLEVENQVRAGQVRALKWILGVSWAIFSLVVGAGWLV